MTPTCQLRESPMPRSKCPKPEDVRNAVVRYNNERGCGDEDANLWEDTADARELLLEPNDSIGTPVEIEAYVEAVRLWGSIQGVSRSDYPMAADALWGGPVRTTIRGLSRWTIVTAAITDVIRLEETMVKAMVNSGIPKKHYSWASKMLHFLLPATMPIYDSFVLGYLGASDGIHGYSEIAVTTQRCATELAPYEAEIVGDIEPRTLLRAIDKFYWWEGQRSLRP